MGGRGIRLACLMSRSISGPRSTLARRVGSSRKIAVVGVGSRSGTWGMTSSAADHPGMTRGRRRPHREGSRRLLSSARGMKSSPASRSTRSSVSVTASVKRRPTVPQKGTRRLIRVELMGGALDPQRRRLRLGADDRARE